jgi:outer membrane receptor protein involved in Fe transport
MGADYHRTESTVSEIRYSLTNVPSGPFLAGGSQQTSALFARASVPAGDQVTLDFGGRVDFWDSNPTDAALPDKSVTFFSPRAAVAWRQGRVSLQSAVYRANRPPTLNELHRGFRVGNAVTNPNPLLDPETLTGVEGGALVAWNRVSTRVTAFFNTLDGAIANITLSSTPALITRERRNSDKIQSNGVEFEVDARLSPTLSVNGQFVYTSSHFRGSVATPAIEGNQVPQVPAVQGGASLTWTDPRWLTAAIQVRFSGDQYEDDANQYQLGAFGIVDFQLNRTITSGIAGFVSVENLFDEDYDTGLTPTAIGVVRFIGWPRSVRAGVRMALR